MHIDPAAVLAVISGQAQQLAELATENALLRRELEESKKEATTSPR